MDGAIEGLAKMHEVSVTEAMQAEVAEKIINLRKNDNYYPDQELDTEGQQFIEGIVDEEQQRISRLAIKAKAESDRAGEEKKHAAQVAKTKEIGLHYYGVRAVIEQARVKSIEESGQFAVIDMGEGPTVEDARTWHDMSGMEKLESMLYGIFQAGREIKP